jgi:hypothetical protein
MKYETIKDKIKKHINHEFDNNGFDISTHAIRLFLDRKPLDYYKKKKYAKEACFDIIDKWDVRAVSSLLTMFPTVYPSMVEKPLAITYDDNGEWVVEKAKQTA